MKAPFHVYLGRPTANLHPVHFQNAWLRESRNGTIPQDVLDSLLRLAEIARENNVSFEDLVVYALGLAAEAPDDASR